jgi:hypothetical protein
MNLAKRAPECSATLGLENHSNNIDFGFKEEMTPSQSMTNLKSQTFHPCVAALF